MNQVILGNDIIDKITEKVSGFFDDVSTLFIIGGVIIIVILLLK